MQLQLHYIEIVSFNTQLTISCYVLIKSKLLASCPKMYMSANILIRYKS